jgi:cysteine synthase B
VPPVLDASVLDDRFLASNRDAVVGVRRLMAEEAIFAGLSSGAALSVALRVAETMTSGSVVVLFADGGAKYVSAGLWDRDLDDLEDQMDRQVLW